ncbi:hypothetical protein SSABA_v1c03800 [Spiroplasma sabaudiense Ar-1343]|uniref:HTH rpiR-type domain-containing protein n=1 Tax=Spiroplasma sabaudiense Ar-1343 TaxID=1276257 RepID=W6AJ94_9MOLU|nr:hypothetical protein [Spiroplasma sabaudiense]AHI53789.1 hypothetical protein SSABA_v1c03800 [Spiroplasma sabaudiense Ar-1343]
MFKSIKENLTIISNSMENPSYTLIAKYLLNCMENGVPVKSKECAINCFVSESVLTAFAKKYGYDGFREIALRIKVENEYYPTQNNLKVNQNAFKLSNYRKFFDQNLDMIDAQVEGIDKLKDLIEKVSNIYLIASYEQNDIVELFASELQFLGFNAFFNSQRKSNSAWLTKAKKEDLFVFFAFGLDNQYVVNFYQIALQKCANVVVITSSSQRHKFLNASFFVIVDYPDRENISILMRSAVLGYLLGKLIYELK